MVATIMRVPPRSGQEPACYFRKRGRGVAAAVCDRKGALSRRWFGMAFDWQEHLERPRNGQTCTAKLFRYRDKVRFIQRGASFLLLGNLLAGVS